jgi:hypothetical protein
LRFATLPVREPDIDLPAALENAAPRNPAQGHQRN